MSRCVEKSETAFARANKVLVGGVNSPVRAFAAIGGGSTGLPEISPPLIAKAVGAYVTDIDDNTYIDYVGSYGPAILGHAPQHVVTAINKQVLRGTSYGAPTEIETHLAEAIATAVGSIEKVRFVSSGTEAAMTAVRLARGTTGRDKIIKCIGCYHGHVDSLLVSAGSGVATLSTPSGPGVPDGTVADTLLVPYNDLRAAETAFTQADGQIAAMIIEPVAGNMGTVPPAEGYLTGLRDLCDRHGSLLILDEVMSGFRVARGGAQSLYAVRPDLTILGKIIGGGLPVGAVGGPGEIMDNLAPQGRIYQAGTLSGNPVAMAAGLVTLQALGAEGFYEQLEAKSATLERGLVQAATDAGLGGKVCFNRVGSMLCCFFTPGPVTNYATASAGNTKAFAAYFQAMLNNGVYLPPSPFETFFISAAHSDNDIADTLAVAKLAFAEAVKLM